MARDISLDSVCSDLHTFLETKKDARNEFINSLIQSFPKEKNDIASFRNGDVGPDTLAKWVLAHPTCIPLLAKCLEKNGKSILERMKSKAKEYGASVGKTNIVAGNFFKVWAKDFENAAEGTTHERLSKLEWTTNLLIQQVLSQGQKLEDQNKHIDKQDEKIQDLLIKIEFLEQEIHSKDAQIKTLTEENQTLTADKQAREKKIEELEKEIKVLEESRNDFREKLEKEQMERQAEKERMMQEKCKLEMKNKDLEEMQQVSDVIDPHDIS